MKKKLRLSIWVGFALSILTLYLAFRNIPLRSLYEYLKNIHLIWVLPTLALVAVCFALRVLRWQLILSTSHAVAYAKAYHSLMIGFMANAILPGRIGEVLRPAVLRKITGVPYFTGIATVTVERLLDLAALIILFAAIRATGQIHISSAVDFGPYRLNQQLLEQIIDGTVLMGLVILGTLVLLAFSVSRKVLVKIVLWATGWPFLFFGQPPGRYRQRYETVVNNLFQNIGDGFALIRQPVQCLRCGALTISIWLCVALSFHLFHFGFPGVSLTFLESTQMMIIICFFIALPSVPGYWGLWEAGGMVTLLSMGIGAREGAAYTLVNHAVQILPVILAGMLSVAVIGIDSVRNVNSEKNEIALDRDA